MIRCPNWLYNWIDRRGRIPGWVWWLWPLAHWCPEMDALLIVDNHMDCFCGRCGKRTRAERRHRHQRQFFAALGKKKFFGPVPF